MARSFEQFQKSYMDGFVRFTFIKFFRINIILKMWFAVHSNFNQKPVRVYLIVNFINFRLNNITD